MSDAEAQQKELSESLPTSPADPHADPSNTDTDFDQNDVVAIRSRVTFDPESHRPSLHHLQQQSASGSENEEFQGLPDDSRPSVERARASLETQSPVADDNNRVVLLPYNNGSPRLAAFQPLGKRTQDDRNATSRGQYKIRRRWSRGSPSAGDGPPKRADTSRSEYEPDHMKIARYMPARDDYQQPGASTRERISTTEGTSRMATTGSGPAQSARRRYQQRLLTSSRMTTNPSRTYDTTHMNRSGTGRGTSREKDGFLRSARTIDRWDTSDSEDSVISIVREESPRRDYQRKQSPQADRQSREHERYDSVRTEHRRDDHYRGDSRERGYKDDEPRSSSEHRRRGGWSTPDLEPSTRREDRDTSYVHVKHGASRCKYIVMDNEYPQSRPFWLGDENDFAQGSGPALTESGSAANVLAPEQTLTNVSDFITKISVSSIAQNANSLNEFAINLRYQSKFNHFGTNGRFQWLHMQSDRKDIKAFQKLLDSVPQLNSGESKLCLHLLQFVNNFAGRFSQSDCRLDALTKYYWLLPVDVAVEDVPRNWITFISLPYLRKSSRMGNDPGSRQRNGHIIHTNSLMHYKYRFPKSRMGELDSPSTDRCNICEDDLLEVPTLWAILTSTNILITLADEEFDSITQPLCHSSKGPNIEREIQRKVCIKHRSSHKTLTLPLADCKTYLALRMAAQKLQNSISSTQDGILVLHTQSGHLYPEDWRKMVEFPSDITHIEMSCDATLPNPWTYKGFDYLYYMPIQAHSLKSITYDSIAEECRPIPSLDWTVCIALFFVHTTISRVAKLIGKPKIARRGDSETEGESSIPTATGQTYDQVGSPTTSEAETKDFTVGLSIPPLFLWSDAISITRDLASSSGNGIKSLIEATTESSKADKGHSTRVKTPKVSSQARVSDSPQQSDVTQLHSLRTVLTIVEQDVFGKFLKNDKNYNSQFAEFYAHINPRSNLTDTDVQVSDWLSKYPRLDDQSSMTECTWQCMLSTALDFWERALDELCPSAEQPHSLFRTIQNTKSRLIQVISALCEGVYSSRSRNLEPYHFDDDPRNNGCCYILDASLLLDSRLEPPISLQERIWECPDCDLNHSGKTFSSRSDAFQHLDDIHTGTLFVPDAELGQYIFAAEDLKHIEAFSAAFTVLTYMIDCFSYIIEALHNLRHGVSADGQTVDPAYTLPASALPLLERIIHLGICGTYSANLALDSYQATEDLKTGTRLIWSNEDRGILLHTGPQLKLAMETLKRDLMEMSQSSEAPLDMNDDHIGPGYVLSLLSHNLSEKASSNIPDSSGKYGLDVVQDFGEQVLELELRAKEWPQRKLQREMTALKDQISTASEVFAAQLKVSSGLQDHLRPDASKNRRTEEEHDPERQVLKEFRRNVRLQLRVCEARIKDLERMERELALDLEIQEGDNNKAILIFTITTVIFLPLSFVTSFLGMNTVDIRDLTSSQWLFWAIAIPLTVGTVALVMVIGYQASELREFIADKWSRLADPVGYRNSARAKRLRALQWQRSRKEHPSQNLNVVDLNEKELEVNDTTNRSHHQHSSPSIAKEWLRRRKSPSDESNSDDITKIA